MPAEGVFYATDARPCNAQAEVTFLHKTGLTTNAGSDAGIVRSLPGKPFRHYVIAVTSNLGYRYGDPELGSLGPNPCFNGLVDYVCYTERLAKLGGAIDTALAGRGPAKGKAQRNTGTATRRPVRASRSASTSAGMMPRIPPPSMERTRTPATVPQTSATSAISSPAASMPSAKSSDGSACLRGSRTVPAMTSSVTVPFGMKPDFMPK